MNPAAFDQLTPEQLRQLAAQLSQRVGHLETLNQRLNHELAVLRRHRFARRSEQLNADQLNLLDEMIEADIAAIEAELEAARPESAKRGLRQALESGAARPHAILATTFTVKAATELRERARSWLLEKGRIDLATAIGQARLGTVNSVCGQLLKRFCFELGLSPDQTVLSEGQSKRLLKATLAESMETAAQTELVRLTERFGIEQADWSKTVETVVKAALDNDIAPVALRAMGAQNADAMLAKMSAAVTYNAPLSRMK